MIVTNKATQNELTDLVPKGKYFTLLYRSTVNGLEPNQFHSRVDHKGPTLSIVETEEGVIFGGYTSIPWASKGGLSTNPQKDGETFLFKIEKDGSIVKLVCPKGGFEVFHASNKLV